MSYYKLCAISAATGILRNYRKAKRKNPQTKEPYARKLRLTTCYGIKIRDGSLLLPFRPRELIRIPLTPHVQATIKRRTVRSVTLTRDRLSLSIARQAVEIKPRGFIGIERNLDNVTLADTDGSIVKHDLAEATRAKAVYCDVRSHMRRNDVRIRHEVSRKYGCKQREKVKQILHHASKMIVQQAKEQQFGLVMERLTNIRRTYRRGNQQGRWYRGRMNSWSYGELQRQIEYKARWNGIPVIYVNPYGTSAKCSTCGHRMKPEENRTLKCSSCRCTVDRDVNAARNILARGVRFAPIALPTEAMVQEPIACGNPESRWERVNKLKPHEPTS
jgi:IS605 OrfB family transposase